MLRENLHRSFLAGILFLALGPLATAQARSGGPVAMLQETAQSPEGRFAPACIESTVSVYGGRPIPGVFVLGVRLFDPSHYTIWDLTNLWGYYRMGCPVGIYLVIAMKKPYEPAWTFVFVPPGECVAANLVFYPLDEY